MHALETGRYYPVGSDYEVTSRFQVIAGANRDLSRLVADGAFRPDLLARLGMWQFEIPPLRHRREDIEPNLLHELKRSEATLGVQVGFNTDALERYLAFARDPGTPWPANFRDFSGSLQRMCTLAPRGRITRAMVDEEIAALTAGWHQSTANDDLALVARALGQNADDIDPFDLVQLAEVIRTCQSAASISEAGRRLFSRSRAQRATVNDADRLRKYLRRFDLDWTTLRSLA